MDLRIRAREVDLNRNLGVAGLVLFHLPLGAWTDQLRKERRALLVTVTVTVTLLMGLISDFPQRCSQRW